MVRRPLPCSRRWGSRPRDPDAEYLPEVDLDARLALMQPAYKVEVAPFFLAGECVAT